MPGETDIGIVRGQVEVLGGAPVYYFIANAQVTPGSPASIAYAFVQDGILAPGASIEAPLPAAAPGGSVVENINILAFQPSSYSDWLSSLGG